MATLTHRTLYFPDGTYNVSTPIECNSNVWMADQAIIKATAPMVWVVAVGDSVVSINDTSWKGGVIAANDLAQDGIYLRNFTHYALEHVYITDQLKNGVHVGDSTVGRDNYSAFLYDIHTQRANNWWNKDLSCAIPAGSRGVYFDAVSDSKLDQAELVSSQIGVEVNRSSQIISQVHPWARASCGNMTVAFKDNGIESSYIDDHADTPSKYGWQFYGNTPNSSLVNPRFTMNSQILTSTIGIYYSTTSAPSNSIMNATFSDAGTGGHFAKDLDSAGTLTTSGMLILGTNYSPATSVRFKNISSNHVP